MVAKASATEPARRIPKHHPHSTTVRLSEVLEAGLRLDASTYNVDARNAVEELKSSGLPLTALYGDNGLCQEAHNAFRFKRIYVSSERGVPFMGSSEIISLDPIPRGCLSRKVTKRLDELIVKPWDVLISCSGTIGNIGFAGKTLTGCALSQDAIRLRANTQEDAGYVAAFLRSRYGRLQIRNATYGSVVVHIEPHHLENVLIPDLHPIKRTEIGQLMCEAVTARDTANELMNKADKRLHELLELPKLETLKETSKGPKVSKVQASQLKGRFEGSFHDVLARRAEAFVGGLTTPVGTISDARVTKEAWAVTKFRKRVYVASGGIPMLSTKQLNQVDPIDIKRLAKGAHTKDLQEIQLQKDMVTVTCSGTIGKVSIIPEYMGSWAANQHAHRLIASDKMNPGYLYAWLASDFGKCLFKRHSYGSVILEADIWMLLSVPIPIPSASVRNEIGDLVLRANELRDEAWRKEKQAIEMLEKLIRQ